MAYSSILSTNQKHVDEPNNNLKDSESFKFKSKFTNDTDVTRTLETLLINCEIILTLTSSNCVITNSIDEGRFEITDTKFYVA